MILNMKWEINLLKKNLIFENKYLEEEEELEEINDILNEINKGITPEINEDDVYKYSINKNHSFNIKNKNVDNDNFQKFQEIMSILKKPLSGKNIRNINKHDTPFKALLKPKKISLIEKFFIVCNLKIQTGRI